MPERRTAFHRVDAGAPDPDIIAEAASRLVRGELVVFPTETVYGLGANAFDSTAVARIFLAKERPRSGPLIVHLARADDLPRVAVDIPEVGWHLIDRFWPGPLTLIFAKHADVSSLVSAGRATVGVRVPSHPVAHALLTAAALPVAAPSANLFSRPSPTRAAHVLADLDGRVDVVLDAGPSPIGLESTVVDLTTPRPLLRRPGGVTLEALRELLPELEESARYSAGGSAERAPGQLLRHYAPRARLTLYEGEASRVVARLESDAREKIAAGGRIGILAPEEDLAALELLRRDAAYHGSLRMQVCGSRRDLGRAAHELFHAIRTVDEWVDEILAAGFDDAELGRALRDRLVRAAEGRVCRV